VSGPRSEATFSVPWEWLEAVSRRAAEIVLEQKPIAVEAASPYLTITEAAEYCRLLNPAERAVLRSILASAIAKDSADAIRALDDHEERAA
jgi:hypothetical protein